MFFAPYSSQDCPQPPSPRPPSSDNRRRQPISSRRSPQTNNPDSLPIHNQGRLRTSNKLRRPINSKGHRRRRCPPSSLTSSSSDCSSTPSHPSPRSSPCPPSGSNP